MKAPFAPDSLVAFRVDASQYIGTGHVMRCLTLADALRQRGAQCLFLCRPHDGHLMRQIAERGHQCLEMSPPRPEVSPPLFVEPHSTWLGSDWASDAAEAIELLGSKTPDWLVVDHYALDRRWEQLLRRSCSNLMVLDDLADRPHDCDLLIDPTLGRTAAAYSRHIPRVARVLLGPQYALLRPEFAAYRQESLDRRKKPWLRNILITLGGVDRNNVTAAVLDTLDNSGLHPDVRITVVMGSHSPNLGAVMALADGMRHETHVRVDVRDMARLMTASDLAIGAGGGTSWERCCLGLPSLILVLADNQLEMARTLCAAGAVVTVESTAEIAQLLPDLIAADHAEDLLAQLSQAAARITDGLGVDRVCLEMQL